MNMTDITIEVEDLAANDELRQRIYAEAARNGRTVEHQVALENINIEHTNKKSEIYSGCDKALEGLPYIFGLDKRKATGVLKCSYQELARWILEGKLPYDGVVESYEFTSMRWTRDVITGAWLPETIAVARDNIESWRREHRQQQKEKKTAAKARVKGKDETRL
jgi:hypothetical protein